jgi:hypothetical protein
MVLVVLAHPADEAAAKLTRRWKDHDARLLTSTDLTTPGWQATLPGGAALRGGSAGSGGTAVIGGESVPSGDIAGVLVRIPAVDPGELRTIAAGDRTYCAAEMTAFLTWWLTELPGPVVNRPSAASLAGPGWSEAAWQVAAGRLGLRRATTRWCATGHAEREPGRVIAVVGDNCVGTADPALHDAALALARAAGVIALAVTFRTGAGPPVFLRARPWVDIGDPAVADALLAHLLAPAGRPP